MGSYLNLYPVVVLACRTCHASRGYRMGTERTLSLVFKGVGKVSSSAVGRTVQRYSLHPHQMILGFYYI
jgi:hypothetical protein